MKVDEITMRLEEAVRQIGELEQAEMQSYAVLGRRMLPELEEGKHADLAARIREAAEKLAALREEHASLELEHRRRIAKLTCFSCKTVNSEDSAFCEECGTKLGEKPKEYCEACGIINHPGQKFCGECGAKLAAEETVRDGNTENQPALKVESHLQPEAGGFCSECGTKLGGGARFCPECGTEVNKA